MAATNDEKQGQQQSQQPKSEISDTNENVFMTDIDQKSSRYIQMEPSTSREHSSTELHVGEDSGIYDVDQKMATFWPRVRAKIEAIDPKTLREASRHQELQLPLARIKKIMKLDDDVKKMMIGSETPILLAKASEIFVEELTLSAWKHTENNKRKTLQKSDIASALASDDMFDFLIDIVPREDHRRSAQAINPQQHYEEVQAVVADPSGIVSTNGNVQYVLQVGSPEGAPLAAGSLVQATQIGQPIQLPIGSGNQPIQLIALNLPDGSVQQFQVQLPP